MLTVKGILSDKITLDIECVDRVYLNGFIKYLQMPGGLVNFIRQQKKLPIPSPKVLGEMTAHFREDVERFAAEQGLEIVAFEKDAIAREHLARSTGKSGVVLIGRAQEKTSAFQGRRADRGAGSSLSSAAAANHKGVFQMS